MQCSNCGAHNDPASPVCHVCGHQLRSTAAEEDSEPWQDKVGRLFDRELGPPPREVPIALKMAARGLHKGAIYALIAGAAAGVCRMMFPGLDPGCLSPYIAAALVLVLHLVRRRKALWLLRHGIATRAEVLEARQTSTGMKTNSLRYAEGWDLVHTSYSGPAVKNVLRLWTPEGRSVIFKRGGLLGGYGYQGGIYLIDPQDPSCYEPVETYGVPMRPGPDGAWKVWPQTQKWVAVYTGVAVLVLIGGIVMAGVF